MTTDGDNHHPVLVCFDGSDGARAALDVTGELFPGREVVVACYWQPFAESSKRLGINILELVQDADSINVREQQASRGVAEQGAALARAAGLVAEGQAIQIHGPIDEAILAHADEIDAAAIVLGSRSHTSLRSLILGDIANEIVQRATRPVLVAPSQDLARRRRNASAAGVHA